MRLWLRRVRRHQISLCTSCNNNSLKRWNCTCRTCCDRGRFDRVSLGMVLHCFSLTNMETLSEELWIIVRWAASRNGIMRLFQDRMRFTILLEMLVYFKHLDWRLSFTGLEWIRRKLRKWLLTRTMASFITWLCRRDYETYLIRCNPWWTENFRLNRHIHSSLHGRPPHLQ